MNICLRVLKESNKSRFDCRVHIFSDNLSRNSCINNPGILVSPVIKLFMGIFVGRLSSEWISTLARLYVSGYLCEPVYTV